MRAKCAEAIGSRPRRIAVVDGIVTSTVAAYYVDAKVVEARAMDRDGDHGIKEGIVRNSGRELR